MTAALDDRDRITGLPGGRLPGACGPAAIWPGVFEPDMPLTRFQREHEQQRMQMPMSADNARPAEDSGETAWRTAADAGDTDAAYELALLLSDRGEAEEALRWLRTAEAGTDAEHWLRNAAEAGHTRAANFLGLMMWQSGDLAEAEHWYRKAAEAGGHPRAAVALACLLRDRGSLAKAEPWLQKAAEAGDAVAASDHLREVRNCCAHPRRHGWPSQQDVDTANATAHKLLRRVGT
jgi:tetratricopeptide (TPR) repeat protein